MTAIPDNGLDNGFLEVEAVIEGNVEGGMLVLRDGNMAFYAMGEFLAQKHRSFSILDVLSM